MSINLLFQHLLFDLAALVDELLLSFNLGAHDVELGVFVPERVVAHFELLVELPLHQLLALFLPLGLELLQPFEHALSDLLRGLLLVVELLLVHPVFCSEQHGELLPSLLKGGCLLAPQVVEPSFDDLLLDNLVGLMLPLRSQVQVLVLGECGCDLLQLLYK